MALIENEALRIKAYWPIVEDIFHDFNIWEKICKQFSMYKDIDKQFIPYNICELIEASKKIGFDDSKLFGIQMIILISIIEALSIRIKYKSFPKWYKENLEGQKNKKCLTSFQEYNEIYGTGKYLKNFLMKIDESDKINTMIKITKNYEEDVFAPLCYQSQDECFYSNSITTIKENKIFTENLGYSYHCKGVNARNKCPAINDKNIMKEGVSKFARHLSDMRNKFVHESIMPNFLEGLPQYVDEESFTIGGAFLVYTQRNETRNDEINVFQTELTPDYLYNLLVKYLQMLFNDYLDEVK